jgi:hypothetical protein
MAARPRVEQSALPFRENGIDMRVLPDLTADDLKDLRHNGRSEVGIASGVSAPVTR